MADSIRILGIDPGSRKTGYGLIEHSDNKSRHLDSGFIRMNEKHTLAERLFILSRELGKIIDTLNPNCGAIEKIFYAKNAQSALSLGHARGVIILKFSERQLPVHEYQALKVKQTVVGAGKAEKSQIQHMVKILLNINDPLQEDQADALAVALTHAHLWRAQKNWL